MDPDRRTLSVGVESLNRLAEEMDSESERGAILVAAAMLENALVDLLQSYLVPKPLSSDSLFDGAAAPLASFSARIDLAYRIGLISDGFARDLHIIRRIRNDFAHRPSSCTLNEESALARITELDRSHGIFERSPKFFALGQPPSPRKRFLQAASWMLYLLEAERVRIQRIEPGAVEFGYALSYDNLPPTSAA